MSKQSAAEAMIKEFVVSEQFQAGLHKFAQSGAIRADNLLNLLRQYVASPECERSHQEFWSAPQYTGPEHQFDYSSDTAINSEDH